MSDIKVRLDRDSNPWLLQFMWKSKSNHPVTTVKRSTQRKKTILCCFSLISFSTGSYYQLQFFCNLSQSNEKNAVLKIGFSKIKWVFFNKKIDISVYFFRTDRYKRTWQMCSLTCFSQYMRYIKDIYRKYRNRPCSNNAEFRLFGTKKSSKSSCFIVLIAYNNYFAELHQTSEMPLSSFEGLQISEICTWKMHSSLPAN